MKTKDLCQKIGISTRHWAYLLSGKRNAGSDTAKAIARVLSVEKGLFVFGNAKQRRAAWEKAAKRH